MKYVQQVQLQQQMTLLDRPANSDFWVDSRKLRGISLFFSNKRWENKNKNKKFFQNTAIKISKFL